MSKTKKVMHKLNPVKSSEQMPKLTKKNQVACKWCNSKNTTHLSAMAAGKHRYKCGDCNKVFIGEVK